MRLIVCSVQLLPIYNFEATKINKISYIVKTTQIPPSTYGNDIMSETLLRSSILTNTLLLKPYVETMQLKAAFKTSLKTSKT